MLKKIYILLVFSGLALATSAQTSPVVLSSLKVSTIINAVSPELNSFLIELTVSDPSSLSRLEVSAEDGNNRANSSITIFPVVLRNGKPELGLEKYNIPFEGQRISFTLSVRDQMKSPYHKIVIQGFDKAHAITNQLVFNQFN
jgi:hypothetical protein